MDGDGFNDLLIGANLASLNYEYAGATYLVKGPVTNHQSLAAAHAKLMGGESGAYAGGDLSMSGDVDGDGLPDMLIGAKGLDIGGGAYLQLGPVTGEIDLSAASAVLLGYGYGFSTGAVALVGDVDQDGYGDLLIGAQGDSSGGSSAGAAYLVYGPVSGTYDLCNADARLIGENAGDNAGYCVSEAGDVNGDAIPDMAIGTFYANGMAHDAGTVYILLGGLGM